MTDRDRWAALASRVKEAIESDQEDERTAREAEARKQAEEAQARAELLDDLEGFAAAVGHFAVQRSDGVVRIRLGDR